MSEFKVGDKVFTEAKILAIEEGGQIYKVTSICDRPYCIEYAVGNQRYEDNVYPIPDKTYKDGLNEAWEFAGKLFLGTSDGGMKCDDMKKIFNMESPYAILKKYTAKECIEKIKAWEDEKEIIHVGDIVTDSYGNKDVVTGVGGQKETDTICILRADGYAGTVYKSELTKTGRTIDIERLLKQIGGTE